MNYKNISRVSLFLLLISEIGFGQVARPATIATDLLIPPPTPGYLDTFNTILKDQQDIFGSNFYHDNEISLNPAIRGLGIHTWYPETRANGKAYKECNCAKLTYYHQFYLNLNSYPGNIGSWSDYDLTFHVKGHQSRFDHFFKIGAPSSRIKDQIDLEVNLIKNAKVPTNDGFEEVEDITGDPDNTENMEFEVQPAYPALSKLNARNTIDNIFGDYLHFPIFLCGYGAWVRDILHPLGYGRPEIHPLEQFWWKSKTSGANYQFGNYNFVLVNDASGRFMYGNINKLPLPGVIAIGFETSKLNPISYGINTVFATHTKKDYKDGKQHYLVIGKDTLIRAIEVNEGPDDYYDISFERLTKDNNNIYRGYLVIKSKIGEPMKTSEFIAQKHLQSLIQAAPSIPKDILGKNDAIRQIENVLYRDGCYNCTYDELLKLDSIKFFGGLQAFVRKTSNQKVTIELKLEKIKRLKVNSFRDSLEVRGQLVEIHDPSPIPPDYNEKSVFITLGGGEGSKIDVFIPSLNVGEEVNILNKSVSWKGYISDNPSWRINCYKDESKTNPVFLGSFYATGDPLKNGTTKVITQLIYDGFHTTGNANIVGAGDNPTGDNTTIDNPVPVEVNLFQITYSYRVVPIKKPDTH